MRVLVVMVTAFVAFTAASPAFAQGCALCYTTASAAGAAAQHSLDVGILTLLVPALTLFLGVIFLLYRRALSAST